MIARVFGHEEAAHLMRRIAWAPRKGEVARAVADGPRATVRRLLGGEVPARSSAAEIVENALRQSDDRTTLTGVLLHRAIVTAEPLRERLVHFWHNHFVSALSKVGEGRMMLAQFALFRNGGAGSFRALTRAVSRDPAMVRYLDSERSTRDAPNENFARELLELFTTGPGPYDENDIREAARAFTGYHLLGGRFEYSSASHDDGDKTVLGKTGPLDGDDVVDLCVDHPQTRRFMARKLARAFVADDPDEAAVAFIADAWKQHDGHVGEVLQALLTSALFYRDRYRYALTRSPTDLVLATVRATGAHLAPRTLAEHVEGMGQTLVDPPTVKGYDGGAAWLNPATLLKRRGFLVAAALEADLKGDLSAIAVQVLGRALDGDAKAMIEKRNKDALALLLCHPDFQRA